MVKTHENQTLLSKEPEKKSMRSLLNQLGVIAITCLVASCNNQQVKPGSIHSGLTKADSLIAGVGRNLYKLPLLDEDRFKNEFFTSDIFNDTGGTAYYCKSINYDIRIKYQLNGKLLYEYVTDIMKQLTYTKDFYSNGQLKEEATLLAVYPTYVGKWKHYSESGKLEKMIDYDKKHKISYFKAIEIAATKNYVLPNIYVSLETEVLPNTKKRVTIGKKFWRIERLVWDEFHVREIWEGIDINDQTGEVTKTPEMMRIN